MRLIDADELIKDRVENDPVRIAAMCAPTVCDLDMLCERIDRESLGKPTPEEFNNGIYKAIEIIQDWKRNGLLRIAEEYERHTDIAPIVEKNITNRKTN